VDAGSAGALTFASFFRHGIQAAQERVLAYLNVSSSGLLHGHAAEPGYVGDHFHPALHSIALAESILKEYPSEIIGWKARLTAVLAGCDTELEHAALNTLIELRDRTQRPVMVHHVESSVPPEVLLNKMGRRDVFTHLYHGRGGSIFHPETGEPLAEAWAARERGVLFDVGHGSGSFRWETAERACQKFGFWPDTISSDLHRYNLFWPVRDLATTLSKFLHLGASLETVIAMVTGNTLPAFAPEIAPASLLSPSAPADLTLFEIEEGVFPLVDSEGVIRVTHKRILPLAVIRTGNLSPCYGFRSRPDVTDAFAISLQSALCL
jgi:dihydroorotase